MDQKEQLSQIGTRVRELLEHDPQAGADIRDAREALLEKVARRKVAPHSAGWLESARSLRSGLLLVAATAVVAGLWLWKRPVTFQIGEAHQGQVGDLVEARGRAVPVAFTDGSTLALHDGGRMRVLSVDSGARSVAVRVLLEDGALDASVAHPRGVQTSWRFEAGPYQVLVTGTKFGMQFAAEQHLLRVFTKEGRVIVTGGCLPTPRAVAAGQSLDAQCPVPEPPVSAPSAASSAAEPAPEPSTKPGLTRSDGWRELLAAGRLKDGLRAAERANFATVCQTATPSELLALADAGRFFGPYARAIAALSALRSRFPGTAEAGTAAFTLGRIAFDNESAYGRAAKWFDTYLQEQPAGPLMGDAFGRLIEARLRSGDSIGARSTAQQYLHRFPGGPYASEARRILAE